MKIKSKKKSLNFFKENTNKNSFSNYSSKNNKSNKNFKNNKNNNLNKVNINKAQNSSFSNKSDFKKEYEKKIESIYGKKSFDKFLKLQKNYSKITYIRVNISKISNKEVEDFFKKNRIKFSKTFLSNSYKIENSHFNLSSSLLSLTGKIYIQDLASQFPIYLIDFKRLKQINIKENRKVQILDMAAAPGSKTTQLLDLLNYYKIDYELIAIEKDEKRVKKLINNIQKQGFLGVKIYNISAQNFNYNKKFDLILLDAPCSGNLIDDKNWLNKRDLKGIEKMSEIQKELLINAKKLIRKDGSIIYSTCSFEKEENEDNIEFAKKELGFEVERLNQNKQDLFLDIKKEYKNRQIYRFNPLKSKTQGFFSVLFRNK